MIDWDAVSKADCGEELQDAKLWLFRENVRLENERKKLEEMNKRMAVERKRLKDENRFFEKKFAILQDGFRKLEEDRLDLERRKKNFVGQQAFRTTGYSRENLKGSIPEEAVRILFRSVNNPMALRKRYRDLVKIFHPDNLFGDAELVQLINKEYLRRKREE